MSEFGNWHESRAEQGLSPKTAVALQRFFELANQIARSGLSFSDDAMDEFNKTVKIIAQDPFAVILILSEIIQSGTDNYYQLKRYLEEYSFSSN